MIRLRVDIDFDINTGETFKALDYTGPYEATLNPGGFGAPNIEYSDVNATRFIWSSYLKETTAGASSTIVNGVEYLVGGTGSFTFDTKTYSAGDTFISMTNGTPTLNDCTLTQTGRYCSVTDFLPADIQSSDFTPSLLGIDSLIFPDSTYSVEYEVYTTVYAAGTLRPAGTYIVTGSVGDTVTVGSATYRIGEVFTQGSTFTTTGAGSIVAYYATTVDDNGEPDYTYFLLGYNAYQAIKNLELSIANSQCPCVSKALPKLQTVNNNWQALQLNFSNDLSLDISGSQILLDEIISITSTPCK